MSQSRREVALVLAEELLSDIELSQIPAPDVVRKTSRLARLLDDVEASNWLKFEISGYPKPLSNEATAAANRSGRNAPPDAETRGMRWWTASLSQLQSDVETGKLQIQAASDAPVSISSANPNQYLVLPKGNTAERSNLRNFVAKQEALIGNIVGSVHAYIAEKEIELRFGAAVEDAFMSVRNTVDVQIARLAPNAAVKLAAAFESASSSNPEHWANAASACRRLLKEVADSLQPSGPPINGRPMTEDKYINRLINWISTQPGLSRTFKDVFITDLEDFGKRIDAFDDAGHKGAHAEVTRYEASRFIAGVYLLIGDILNLWTDAAAPQQNGEPNPSVTR